MSSGEDKCAEATSAAFAHIQQSLDGKMGFHVTIENSVFLVSIDESNSSEMTIPFNTIPCFLSSVPEMLASYVVAQLLQVATAADGQRSAALLNANLAIQAKVTVLHQMNVYMLAQEAS